MVSQNELLRDELSVALGNVLGHELLPHKERFDTTLEVLYAFNLHYLDVVLGLVIKDIEGKVVASPTIVLKKGDVIGSGDSVSANEHGAYVVRKGIYNYSVSKTGYETTTGTIEIEYIDAESCNKDYSITLHRLSEVSLVVTDVDDEPVTGSTIVIKKGAVIGSGAEVTAEADDTYKLGVGTYNYSVSKEDYETETGTFAIAEADLDKTKTVTVVLTVDAE